MASLFRASALASARTQLLASTTTKRWGHNVRLIAVQDLPHSRGYKGDVVSVKAGFARNFLIPKKLAIYATPQNFEKHGIVDPDVETEEERIARLVREASFDQREEQLLKEADMLRHYLRNKVLKIWRVVDSSSADVLHPGKVNSWNLRKQISTQLKVDLGENEKVHICSKDPLILAELDETKMESLLEEVDAEKPCDIQIKRLGEYVARIGLEGGYTVPLRFLVVQRVP